MRNLKLIFPQHTKTQLNKIAKLSYRNFFDIIFETTKGFTLNKQEMIKRLIIDEETKTKLRNYHKEGKSCILFTAHFNNWEWAANIQFASKHECCFVYKTLHNKFADKYVKNKRSRFGAHLAPPNRMTRAIIKLRNTPTLYGLIADQRPGSGQASLEVDFFGHTITGYSGPEIIAKKLNSTIFYASILRVKRGFYQVHLEKITDTPQAIKDGEITQRCFDLLQKDITRTPSSWFWLHNRFKNIKQ